MLCAPLLFFSHDKTQPIFKNSHKTLTNLNIVLRLDKFYAIMLIYSTKTRKFIVF